MRLASNAETQARLQIAVSGDVVFDRSIKLTAGANEVSLEVRFKRAGANPVQARLATPDGHAQSSLQSVWVGPRLRLLFVEGGRTGGRYLSDALAAQGIDVESVTPERFAEEPAAALHSVDAVLLSDVPADRLMKRHLRRLEAFVAIWVADSSS